MNESKKRLFNISVLYVVNDSDFEVITRQVIEGKSIEKTFQIQHEASDPSAKTINLEKEIKANENPIQVTENDFVEGAPTNISILSTAVSKFNRELLKTTCQVMGCKPIHAHQIAEELFAILNSLLNDIKYKKNQLSTEVICLKKSAFISLFIKCLHNHNYKNAKYIRDYYNALDFINRKYPLLVLLGGTSGTGKSTLASLTACRLGISNVLSTDSIRHILRNFTSKEQNPILFASTYETFKFVNDDPVKPKSQKKKTIEGYKIQCAIVQTYLERVVGRIMERNESVVVEGVHLTVSFMKLMMSKYQHCIPFMIYIKDENKHKERFAVRAKEMTIDPKYNKYIENFENISIIHKWNCKKAENYLIPRIDNTNVDKGLGIIHSTIIRCMRKFTEGIPLFDIESKKPTILLQEFNIVIKNKLSSREAQDIISSKVYKGEIFKRFFEDQQKNMQYSPLLTDLFQPRSVDDNDVNEKKAEETKATVPPTQKQEQAPIQKEDAQKEGINNTSKSQENILINLQQKKDIKTKKKLVHLADPIKFKGDLKDEETAVY
jgi:2-phosphoglycerate kinase